MGFQSQVEVHIPRPPSIPKFAFHSEGKDSAPDYTTLEKKNVPLVDKAWFCGVMSTLMFANLIALGLQVDLRCRSNCVAADFAVWDSVDLAFTLVFVADVVVALVVLRPKVYFCGDPDINEGLGGAAGVDIFRCLDFTLVLLRAVDVFLLSKAGLPDTHLKYLSAFRVIHLGRFASRVQLIGAFRELWLILSGMADTLRTVGWVAALLVLVLWVFAVVITMAVNDGTVYNYDDSPWTKEDYWGTVPSSLFSLFQVLTRDKWSSSLVWPLIEAKTTLVIFFILFICIAMLALLNTIVGVVVESTLRSARENEEKEVRERQKQDTKIMHGLEKIFQDADTDKSGDLDEQELAEAMKNHKVKKALGALGISQKDLEILFALLDEDGSGNIKTDMFFRGCTRLRGPAMARDLQTISVDLDRHVKTSSKQIKQLRNVNDQISEILDVIDTIEVDIVKDPQDEKDPVLLARRARVRGPRSALLRTVNNYSSGDDGSDTDSSYTELSAPLPHIERTQSTMQAFAAKGRRRSSFSVPSRRSGGGEGLRWAAQAGGADGVVAFAPPANPRPPPIPEHLRQTR